ncbi:MAG: hypothetical protein MJ231_03665 [bacterium]|nr:hypothetical protein [bacterium]
MMSFNPFEFAKEFIFKHYHQDTAKMLIWTGVTGYVLSSAAQVCAILFNSKIDDKTKSFLLPQECMDALANIVTFVSVTTLTKHGVAKLYQTGKWAPKSVKKCLESIPKFKNDIGKLNLNLDKELVAAKLPEKFKDVPEIYKACKSKGTTVATILAGIVSSSIITPLIRNKLASKAQKNFINYKKETSPKIEEKQPQPTFKSLHYDLYQAHSSSGLKI